MEARETCIPDTHSNETIITPGLIGLNLNILHGHDLHMVQDAIDDIRHAISVEHPIVHTVQKHLIALLKTKRAREQHIGRQELEQIVKDSPNNLNVLSDLEHVYRCIHRNEDAEQCKRRYEKILSGKSEEDVQSKIKCLLEQGYAIRREKTVINELTLGSRLTELHKSLTKEFEHCSGERKQYIAKCLRTNKETLLCLQHTTRNTTVDSDGHLIRLESSLQKFEHATSLCPGNDLPLEWLFHFAKTLNQYYDSLENLAKISQINLTEKMGKVTIQTVELFWKVGQEASMEDMKRYKAHSYAYIGHIFSTRKYLFKRVEGNYAILDTPDMKSFINDPFLVFKKAYDLLPTDKTVLNRYGRCLWIKAKRDKKMQRKILKDAESILTASLENDPHENRFAYSNRMLVRKDLAKSSHDKTEQKMYLENAKQDGEACLSGMTTRRVMSTLAQICQQLAKFPNTNKFGSQFVKPNNKIYLHQALDFLNFGNNLAEPPDCFSTYRMASCLSDLGEYDAAVACQKRAWFLAGNKSYHNFRILCLYMYDIIHKEDFNQTLLTDFLCLLIRGKIKYGCTPMQKTYTFLYKRKYRLTMRLLRKIIIHEMQLHRDEKLVLRDFLTTGYNLVRKKRLRHEIRGFQKSLDNIVPVSIHEGNMNPSRIRFLEPKVEAYSKQFKFDFFVSFSHEDYNWVRTILIAQLENGFDREDIVFKGKYCVFVCLMVINATFSNISVIS